MGNTLSGPVDVVAVLKFHAGCQKNPMLSYGKFCAGDDIEQTLAAVAELIERARALRSAHCAFQDWKAKAPKRYPAPRSILEMNVHAKAMLFAALDRVGGAK